MNKKNSEKNIKIIQHLHFYCNGNQQLELSAILNIL